MNNEQNFINASLQGQYYCPPGMHYSPEHPELVNVICDRCGLGDLQACIGYNQLDLCLQCNQIMLTIHAQQQQINVSGAENKRLRENVSVIKLIPLDGGFLVGNGESSSNINSNINLIAQVY
jgi:hypothetical protein